MDKIYVAKLGKTVGLKGQQKIYIDSDFPDQFKKNSVFFTQKNKQLIVESFNSVSSTIKFVGIDSIDDAKKLTNSLLFVSKDDTKENCVLEDDQYFWFDLVDCKIIEDDELLGIIDDIQRLPLDDYFVVKTSQELIDKGMAKIFMIPYKKEYIKSVDIDNKVIFTQNTKDILKAS